MEDNGMISLIALCVLASAAAAFSKNRSMAGWAIAAVLLPVLSLIVVCCLPAVSVENEENA